GNSTRVPYALSVRSSAPEISILEDGSPIAAGSLFNRAVTPLIHISDAGASVTATLNGAPFSSGSTIAADGAYTLAASATDTAGHTANASASFTIDRTPPAIRITSPANGATLNADRVEVQVESTGADTIAVNGAAGTAVPLEIGPNVITAVATDRAGNSASDQIAVTRDDGRKGIVLIAPADGALTNRPAISVAGQVLTPAAGLRVTVNGNDVPV